MAIWLRTRTLLLGHITGLPPQVNRALMALNRRPDRLYGKAYRSYRASLERDTPAHDHIKQLLAAVNHAISTTPYYRERYGTSEIRSLAQFEASIGFIDRDTVLENAQRFVSDGVDRADYDMCSTGGTSGKPLTFLAPKRRYVVELATMHSLWSRAGYQLDVRAVIRNHRLDGQRYIVNPLTREVIFDGFRLTEDDFAEIYRTIVNFGIRFVHCYPSTAYELARFIQRRRLDPSKITAFLSGSETVFDYQRALIQDTLGIRFYNWYGHSEKLVLAGFCASRDHYHVEPSYGYCELLDEEGRVVTQPGVVGEIVGTSFHNRGMPFVRYRTGDLAEYVGNQCDGCGRRVPLLRNIRGRWRGERIYRSDGSFVTTTALNMHDDLNGVIEGMQYVQERMGQLTLLIVPSAQFTARHEAGIHDYLHRRLGAGAQVTVQYVDQLRRGANGKVSFLISNVAGTP
jgi:phenylacetate-CoA ligase